MDFLHRWIEKILFSAILLHIQPQKGFSAMTDNKELFTCKSADYARFRPTYPDAAVSYLAEKCGRDCSVLDVGAGTGIFTQILLKFFSSVAALEPNGNMRNEFHRLLPEIRCFDASGEDTRLPDSSVDLITVAQAFHWLDEDLFKKEAMRILRPGGRVAIVWNTVQKSDFTIARDDICRQYCPRFSKGYAGKRSPAEGDKFLRYSYFTEVEKVEFDNPFSMDKTAFMGNMRSRSYAPVPGDDNFELFSAGLENVFKQYASNGEVVENMKTEIFLGSFQTL